MTALLAATASALWLGLLTSISPCPLASNIAAISFVGRSLGSPRRVVAAGVAYSLGRALSYVLVGVLVVSSVLAIPKVSFFLQTRLNQVLGPLLIFIGVGLLLWGRLRLPTWNWGEAVERRVAGRGILGAGGLGALFALSFCPVSAGLFFGGLLPLAIQAHSRVLLPALYGLGTGLPVLAVAVLLSLGVQWIGRAFHLMTRIEKLARPATGIIFILAGGYLALRHLFGVGW
jgi:cytochrome c-type biogenesis protein